MARTKTPNVPISEPSEAALESARRRKAPAGRGRSARTTSTSSRSGKSVAKEGATTGKRTSRKRRRTGTVSGSEQEDAPVTRRPPPPSSSTGSTFDSTNFLTIDNQTAYRNRIAKFIPIPGERVDTNFLEEHNDTLGLWDLFKFQGWETILGLRHCYYPDLMRVFYANFKVTRNHSRTITGFTSKVRGVTLDYSIQDMIDVLKIANTNTNEGILFTSEKDIPKQLGVSFDAVLENIYKPGVACRLGKTLALSGKLKFLERMIQIYIIKTIRPQLSGRQSVTFLTAFLIYAIKKKILIDTPRMILEHMENCVASSKMPYGRVLSLIFEHSKVSCLNEIEAKDKTTEIGLKTFNQADIRYDRTLKIWRWYNVQVSGANVDLLSDNPKVFETFYGTPETQPSSSRPSIPQPKPKLKPKPTISTLLERLNAKTSRLLKRFSSNKKRLDLMNKKINYLYQLTPIEIRTETNLFDADEDSEWSDDEDHLPGDEDAPVEDVEEDAPVEGQEEDSVEKSGSENGSSSDDDSGNEDGSNGENDGDDIAEAEVEGDQTGQEEAAGASSPKPTEPSFPPTFLTMTKGGD